MTADTMRRVPPSDVLKPGYRSWTCWIRKPRKTKCFKQSPPVSAPFRPTRTPRSSPEQSVTAGSLRAQRKATRSCARNGRTGRSTSCN